MRLTKSFPIQRLASADGEFKLIIVYSRLDSACGQLINEFILLNFFRTGPFPV